MPSIERRLQALENALAPDRPEPLFVMGYGREPAGFRSWGGNNCPDVAVDRLPGEDLSALEARCRALHPDCAVWIAT